MPESQTTLLRRHEEKSFSNGYALAGIRTIKHCPRCGAAEGLYTFSFDLNEGLSAVRSSFNDFLKEHSSFKCRRTGKLKKRRAWGKRSFKYVCH